MSREETEIKEGTVQLKQKMFKQLDNNLKLK